MAASVKGRLGRAAAALAFAALAFALHAQPVAVVTDVRGGVTRDAAGAPLAILSQVSAGDRIGVAAGGTVSLLYYADGAQFDVRGPGTLVADAAAPRALDGAVVAARAAGAAPKVRLTPGGLVQGAIVMRNLGLRIVAPEAQVLALRPALAWTDSRTEATYDVALIDAGGARVFAATTSDRRLALPESLSLRPGASYALEVTARVQGNVAQVARAEFRIAPDELREQARAHAPPSGADVAERVAYALWLDQNALYDEARTWWAGIASARPDQGALRERAGAR